MISLVSSNETLSSIINPRAPHFKLYLAPQNGHFHFALTILVSLPVYGSATIPEVVIHQPFDATALDLVNNWYTCKLGSPCIVPLPGVSSNLILFAGAGFVLSSKLHLKIQPNNIWIQHICLGIELPFSMPCYCLRCS